MGGDPLPGLVQSTCGGQARIFALRDKDTTLLRANPDDDSPLT